MFKNSQLFNSLMAMQPHRHRSSIFIQTTTATLLILASGCTSNQQPQATSGSATPSIAATIAKPKVVSPKTASPSPQIDEALERAENKAISAQNLAKSAQSKEDWNLVVSRWQQAIALLQTVPNSHPKKAIAQQKIAASQRQLAAAKQQITNVSKPPVSTTAQAQPINPDNSNPASPKVALAQHLKKIGAKMYSTYWCSTCRWQERQFGEEAQNLIKSIEIECDPRGKNAKPELCFQAQVRAYPTWEINGQLYGPMRLDQLADISGYQGPRNFDI